MKLYVDCDETLVFWENPLLPYQGNFKINTDLVDVLKNGIDVGEYDVTIWSAGGTSWAAEVSRKLFNNYNLPSSGKHELYHQIPNNAYAIDDRLVEDRFYLYRFKKVFLPEEFVQYARNIEEVGVEAEAQKEKRASS